MGGVGCYYGDVQRVLAAIQAHTWRVKRGVFRGQRVIGMGLGSQFKCQIDGALPRWRNDGYQDALPYIGGKFGHALQHEAVGAGIVG